MPEPLQPDDIVRREFEVTRRGYDQQAVRGFLHELSSQLSRAAAVESDLRERLSAAEKKLAAVEHPDEATMLELLGEETTRVLTSAREAAADIRAKAEQAAERIIAEASAQAAQTRSGAVAEADKRLAEAKAEGDRILAAARGELERRTKEATEAADRIRAEAEQQAQAIREEAQKALAGATEQAAGIVEQAKEEGKALVVEAQGVREKVLRDLAARRKKAKQQIEQLNAGRERLLQAYEVVRSTIDAATSELSSSVTDARAAAAAAARRIALEPDPTVEDLDRELAGAYLEELPITVARAPRAEPKPAPEPAPAAPAVPERRPPSASDFDPMPMPEPAARGRRPAPGPEPEPEPEPQAAADEAPAAAAAPAVVEAPAVEPAAEPEPEAEVAEPEAKPEAEVEAEVEVAASPEDGAEAEASEPEPEPEAEPAPEPATASEPAPSAADAVFQRLRAEAPPEPEAPAAAEASEPEPVVEAAEPSEVERAFADRAAALESVERDLAKRLKRILADEQNEVLDQLRRGKPTGVDDLLPSADDHAGRWAATCREPLAAAARAGAAWSGGSAAGLEELADELARGLVLPLRERIERSFAASDGNLDDVADRVRALYREWKHQRLPEAAPHYAAAAYARGLYEGAPAEAQVHWVPDPSRGACPDCDDNVLAGNLAKGEEFPTGDRCAPAHPGCRCLVLVATA